MKTDPPLAPPLGGEGDILERMGLVVTRWDVGCLVLAVLLAAGGFVAYVPFARLKQAEMEYQDVRRGMIEEVEALRARHRAHGTFGSGLVPGRTVAREVSWFDGFHRCSLEVGESSVSLRWPGRDGAPGGEGWNRDIRVGWTVGDPEIEVESAPVGP